MTEALRTFPHHPQVGSVVPAGLERAINGMALAFVVVSLGVSPFALNMLGWNYDGVGGSGPTRFHPATFLALLTLLLILLRSGNPLASALTMLARDPLITVFLAIWAVLMFHATSIQKLPAATLVDTFLLPVFAVLILRGIAPRTRARLEWVIHAVFAINAVIGIGEFGTGLRLTPYVAGGIAITDDWRSTALLGHPLGNALMTGCYAALLMIGGGGQLNGRLRLAAIGLQFAAMVAFGGRASLVLLLLFGIYALMRPVLRFLAGARVPLRDLTALALVFPIALAVLGALLELGFFDKFIYRFIEDKGSAEARIVMFQLFRWFTLPELLFGPPQNQLHYLVGQYSLEFGIESLWVAFFLYYGVIPSGLFFAGLFLFILSVVGDCQRRVWWVLAYFFVVNSTFLGLGGKTVTFANLVMMMMVLVPRRPPTHVSSILAGYGSGLARGHP